VSFENPAFDRFVKGGINAGHDGWEDAIGMRAQFLGRSIHPRCPK
jgi:hypothetical protein